MEANFKKQVVMLEISNSCEINVKPLEFKPKHNLKIVKGQFEEILNLTTEDFVSIELTNKNFVLEPLSRLKKNCPRILNLTYKNQLFTNFN